MVGGEWVVVEGVSGEGTGGEAGEKVGAVGGEGEAA